MQSRIVLKLICFLLTLLREGGLYCLFIVVCMFCSDFRYVILVRKFLSSFKFINMNNIEKLKNVIPIFLFNILLPTADIVTDLELIIKLFLGNWHEVGTALLIPFTLNYIFTMACWMRSKEKIQTIIFPVLNIYPQFCEYMYF